MKNLINEPIRRFFADAQNDTNMKFFRSLNLTINNMKKIIITISLTCNLLICSLQLSANNIQVNNAALTGQVPASNYTLVQFDLSWENSWRDGVNWDAAWVFVKYKASYDTTWKHATLNTSGHTIPGSFTGTTPSDGKGIFIYRSVNGNGNVNLANTQLRWNYGADGLNDGDLVQVKVFAIEMVYAPQGNFYAGDGTLSNVTGQFSAGNTTAPYFITSENSLTLGGAPITNLGNRNASGMSTADDFNNTTTQTLPAGFPKGYNAFYCMKYEISQGAYTDFLNTLTRTQQQARVASFIGSDVVSNVYVMSSTNTIQSRNVITCPSSGNGILPPIVFSCTRIDRACNFLAWMDGAAYMDWSGLRPMTELEFEKVCRGTSPVVADEYAWGTTVYVPGTNISGTENGTETITTAGANVNNNGPFTGGDGGLDGPLRCGIFAKVSTTREQSGASYYGVMEMSASEWERTAGVGNTTGRLFTGLNGDGMLSPLGNANVANWAGLVSGEVTGAAGANQRGGAGGTTFTRTSDRQWGNFNPVSRSFLNGCRGVRIDPLGGTLSPNNK